MKPTSASITSFFVPKIGTKRSRDDNTVAVEQIEEHKSTKAPKESKMEQTVEVLPPIVEYLTDDSWKGLLAPEFKKTYFNRLVTFIETEYKNQTIFPPKSLLFNAFNLCSYHETLLSSR